jgi:transcriptional regulator with XRE-family HTH domain
MTTTTRPTPRSLAPDRAFLRAMGKRIRLARVERELSQGQLAERAGMSRNFVSSIERGAHGVDVLRLRWLAQALHTHLDQLVPREDDPSLTGTDPQSAPPQGDLNV